MPRHNNYEGPLCQLMTHAHGPQFPRCSKDTLFTKAQLLELHSQHIHNWLAYKAFGKTAFSLENGDRPVHPRSSHLVFLKKAISYFTPENAPHWCNGQGNPTKHKIHRQLMDNLFLHTYRNVKAGCSFFNPYSSLFWAFRVSAYSLLQLRFQSESI